ncbi:MAG: endonuclease [Bacteroidales bacterium]|nr:endonuclease [Bacteroidales bacterium]
MKRLFSILLLTISFSLSAQIPAGYYNSAINKHGYALRVALHNIIKNHNTETYNQLWYDFYATDVRPDGKVWDIYSDNPNGQTSYLYSFGNDQCGSYTSEGDCYNREHSVPKSWFNEATPMYTDLFHLYPTDGYVNGRRSNFPYGEVSNVTWVSSNGSKLGYSAISGYSGTVFEPIDAYKGDLARTYLYMATCYMDKDFGYEGKSMFEGGSLKPWALQMLLNWCANDPVSQKEIDRNNAVYEIQNNRNPFIDFPELANMIFGSDTLVNFQSAIDDYLFASCSVYPNPATDFVHVSLSQTGEPVTGQLYNITGQAEWTATLSEGEESFTIPMQDMPQGVYILHLRDSRHHAVKKILKR